MTDIWTTLSFGVGGKNQDPVDHDVFDAGEWDLKLLNDMKPMARSQLGTIGSGNHYVDFFVDEQDRVWVGVHFGSRGLGYKIATYFIKSGGGKPNDIYPVVLDVKSNLGQDYLSAMTLAGKYAYGGRDWVCNKVSSILQAEIVEEVHNHHNFAWNENHCGDQLWVVRKGATPAHPGQVSFVGGSMGDISAIVEGIQSIESQHTLYSTVHGAGRVMSRTQAAGRLRKGKRSGGMISRQMMLEWVNDCGIELRGAGTDESPHCYRRLPEVLKHHSGGIRILHTLQPVGVAMARARVT